MTLRLVEIEGPLDDVEFPNGTKHVPVPFGPTEYQLWRDLPLEPDDAKRGRMLMDIILACYPTATIADIDTCTPKMLFAMAAHAGHRIEQIREALKNVIVLSAAGSPQDASKATPPDTTPSSPKMSGTSSSRKSRSRGDGRGTRPTTTRTRTTSGSRSTSSTK